MSNQFTYYYPFQYLEEKKYRLKYLYFIDTNKIISNIKSKRHNFSLSSSQDYSDLLHATFSEIYKHTQLYNSYLAPEGRFFFGLNQDVSNQSYFRKLFSLLYLSLQNHCIIHGFFTTLTNHENRTICLSAKFDDFNSKGYFSSVAAFENTGITTTENMSPQYYNKNYKHWRSSDYKVYSGQIIQSNCDFNPSPKQKNLFNIPLCFKNAYHFLLTNPEIKNFDRALSNDTTPQTLISDYTNLYKSCINTKQKFDDTLEGTLDQFLFTTFFEYFYSFSSTKYAFNLLSRIHDTENKNDSITLKDLEGSHFYNILFHIFSCPLLYSRNFIMEYMCYAITQLKHLEKLYLKQASNQSISYHRPPSNYNKLQELNNAFKLCDEFLTTLNNVTIPILEDTWDVVVNELAPDYGISLNTYKEYIYQNIDVLTFDLSTLSKDDLHSIEISLPNSLPLDYISVNEPSTRNYLIKKACTTKVSAEEASKDLKKKLLTSSPSYYNTQLPLFFKKFYSSLPKSWNLDSILFPPELPLDDISTPRSREETNVKQFRINHLKNYLDYLYSN